MKTILNAVGRTIDLIVGASGGLVFSVLACMTVSTALRIASVQPRGTWAVYVGLLLAGPIIGLRRRDYFAYFIAPVFNATAGSDGSGDLGPDNVDSVRDWLMAAIYIIGVILLVVATVFSARTPLILSTALLVAYAFHAKKAAKAI